MRLMVFLILLPVLYAQEGPRGDWESKTIQLKYADPEEIRSLYGNRSFAMQANRQLKTLTLSGPAAFLNEVEQTAGSLDNPPASAADIEVTAYLLSADVQGALPSDLPNDVQTLLPGIGSGLGLADKKTVRVGDGQGGDLRLSAPANAGAALAHVSFQTASASAGSKKSTVSVTGLRCWLAQPAAAPASNDSDFTSSVRLVDGQPALVMQSGVRKPIAVILRASITR